MCFSMPSYFEYSKEHKHVTVILTLSNIIHMQLAVQNGDKTPLHALLVYYMFRCSLKCTSAGYRLLCKLYLHICAFQWSYILSYVLAKFIVLCFSAKESIELWNITANKKEKRQLLLLYHCLQLTCIQCIYINHSLSCDFLYAGSLMINFDALFLCVFGFDLHFFV
jgi:hypothetical protein